MGLFATLMANLKAASDQVYDLVRADKPQGPIETVRTVLHLARNDLNQSASTDADWDQYVRRAMRLLKDRKLAGDAPQPIQLSTIRRVFLRECASGGGRATYSIVHDVDALRLPASPFARNGAVVQVNGQFNFLPPCAITECINQENAQGPRAALSSLPALIWRTKCLRGVDANARLFAQTAPGRYKDGRLTLGEEDPAPVLKALQKTIGRLRILAQWCVPDQGQQPLMQVFTAAPTEGGPIASMLATAQCTAVAQLAALRACYADKRVPLHLTLAGPDMREALDAVSAVTRDRPVDVYVHTHGDADLDAARAVWERAPVITSAAFFRRPSCLLAEPARAT